MSTAPKAQPDATTHFTSQILLWVRSDQPRHAGMDYWKAPHSGIIAATPGLNEYRQIHLAEQNAGLWPPTSDVETNIPAERKIDGVAEVTFRSVLSPLLGRAQTALAYQDEVNVFRRTLLYAGLPDSSRWYQLAPPGETVSSRALIYLRRRAGVRGFKKFINTQLIPSLVHTGVLKELRTQAFLPWIEKLWNTPNVAHDNPDDQHFHASVMLGFTNTDARDAFFSGTTVQSLSHQLAPFASAVHAYDVTAALTFVRDGHILPHAED